MFKTMIAAASLLILSPNTLWACPQGTKAITTAVNGKKACEISGEYLNSQIHLNNNFVYVLNGEVQIGGDGKNSSTLSIDPGVTLYGRPDSYIIISRGSQIYAQGSAQQPLTTNNELALKLGEAHSYNQNHKKLFFILNSIDTTQIFYKFKSGQNLLLHWGNGLRPSHS